LRISYRDNENLIRLDIPPELILRCARDGRPVLLTAPGFAVLETNILRGMFHLAINTYGLRIIAGNKKFVRALGLKPGLPGAVDRTEL
jgi:hypothetical protein